MFIGAVEAARWRANGWPPPFLDLATKPLNELWKISPAAARLFARSPREIDPRSAIWGTVEGADVDIAGQLAARSDPWRAASIKDLWELLGHEVETSLKQQWLIAMGLGGYPTRPHEFGIRNPASPLIVPTRTTPPPRKLVGAPAFRLRFDVDPTTLPESSRDDQLQLGGDQR